MAEAPPVEESFANLQLQDQDGDNNTENQTQNDDAKEEPLTDEEDLEKTIDEIHRLVHLSDFTPSKRILDATIPLFLKTFGVKAGIHMLVNSVKGHEVKDSGLIRPLLVKARTLQERLTESTTVVDPADADYHESASWQSERHRFPLHAAAERGDLSEIKALLEAGRQVDEPAIHIALVPRTPLMVAIFFGQTAAVELLVESGADVNFFNSSGKPLGCLTQCLDEVAFEDILNILLENGAEVNNIDDEGKPLIMEICLGSIPPVEIFELLVEAGSNLNYANKLGDTTLHWLAYYSKQNRGGDIAELLIENGADVYAVNQLPGAPPETARTPLWKAVERGCDRIVTQLLQAMKSGLPETTTRPHDLTAELIIEMLQISIKEDYAKITELLIGAMQHLGGALHQAFHSASSVEAPSGKLTEAMVGGIPLLHYVTSFGDDYAGVVAELLEESPLLVSVKDANDEVSLFSAIRNGQSKLVTLHVNAADADNNPVLDLYETDQNGRSFSDVACGNDVILAALAIDRGQWLRALYEADRNILKICYKRNLVQGPLADYTFVPVVKYRSSDSVGDEDMDSLPMDQRAVLIYYNESFQGKDPEHDREGGMTDLIRLSRLFTSYGIDVYTEKNLTAAETKNSIDEKRELLMGRPITSLVVIVMSHGASGYIEGVDGGLISIDDDIVSAFDGRHAPPLKAIPKLFLIQACRGSLTAGYMDEEEKMYTVDAAPDDTRWAGPTDIHPKANILKIFSTYSDYVAVRHKERGSWFIEEFVLMSELYSHLDDVTSIANKANHLLGKRLSYNTGGVQVAEVQSSLQKPMHIHRILPGNEMAEWLEDLRAGWRDDGILAADEDAAPATEPDAAGLAAEP